MSIPIKDLKPGDIIRFTVPISVTIIRQARTGDIWLGQAINNDRRTKFWVRLDTASEMLICLEGCDELDDSAVTRFIDGPATCKDTKP